MEPVTAVRTPPSLAPEHDWSAASRLIRPALRPVGTRGTSGHSMRIPTHGSPGEPLVSAGPAGLSVVYVLPASGFEVVVSAEHIFSWAVAPEVIAAAALSNLAAWSAQAAWTEETEGGRRVVWSDWGEGNDATRILLPEVRSDLTRDLAPLGRVLIGMPERDLLIATSLVEGDEEFSGMFADYLLERFNDSDAPIDPRVFELVDNEVVEFALVPIPA